MTLRLPAFAKINLDLRVLGVRPDGYHELRTVFQTLRLHDTLTFEARPGPLALTCRTPGVPTDHRNLVYVFNPRFSDANLKKQIVDKLCRWVTKLNAFRYTVEHVSGQISSQHGSKRSRQRLGLSEFPKFTSIQC